MNECHWSFVTTAAADFLFKCIDDAFDRYGKNILTKKYLSYLVVEIFLKDCTSVPNCNTEIGHVFVI